LTTLKGSLSVVTATLSGSGHQSSVTGGVATDCWPVAWPPAI